MYSNWFQAQAYSIIIVIILAIKEMSDNTIEQETSSNRDALEVLIGSGVQVDPTKFAKDFPTVFYLITFPFRRMGITSISTLFCIPKKDIFCMASADGKVSVISRIGLLKEDKKYIEEHPEKVRNQDVITYDFKPGSPIKIENNIYCHQELNEKGEPEMQFLSFSVFQSIDC